VSRAVSLGGADAPTVLGKPLAAYEALIFDVDGTLADTEEIHRRAFNEAFAATGLPWVWSVEDYRDLLKVAGGKERIRHYGESIGAELSEEALAALHQAKTLRYVRLVASGGLQLRPGIREILLGAGFRGQRLAVATTTTRANVEALIETTLGRGAFGLFEVVVAADDVARKKPEPDVYLEVLELLQLPGSACLAFEDSRNGLIAAHAAGLPVVITPSFYTAHEDFSGADLVLEDLSALLPPGGGAPGRR
jgi:HAD superfamily hydrolase (TIGR01509 family)